MSSPKHVVLTYDVIKILRKCHGPPRVHQRRTQGRFMGCVCVYIYTTCLSTNDQTISFQQILCFASWVVRRPFRALLRTQQDRRGITSSDIPTMSNRIAGLCNFSIHHILKYDFYIRFSMWADMLPLYLPAFSLYIC